MSGTFNGRIAYASIRFDGPTPFIENQSGDFSSVELVSGNVFLVHLAEAIDPSEAVYLARLADLQEATVVVTRRETTDNRVAVVGLDRGGGASTYAFDLVVLVKPLQ